jgi:hypothetical protein
LQEEQLQLSIDLQMCRKNNSDLALFSMTTAVNLNSNSSAGSTAKILYRQLFGKKNI